MSIHDLREQLGRHNEVGESSALCGSDVYPALNWTAFSSWAGARR